MRNKQSHSTGIWKSNRKITSKDIEDLNNKIDLQHSIMNPVSTEGTFFPWIHRTIIKVYHVLYSEEVIFHRTNAIEIISDHSVIKLKVIIIIYNIIIVKNNTNICLKTQKYPSK